LALKEALWVNAHGTELKIVGWLSVGALAGALTTISLQTTARGAFAPLPLEELQQLAAVLAWSKATTSKPSMRKNSSPKPSLAWSSSLDPHSQYFDKKSFKEFSEGTSGRFVGVGIEITQEEGIVKVVSPIEGSPADRAGLKTNDLITKIDDAFVKGLSMNEAVKRMRGEPNTKVVLTVFRKDESRTFTLTIVREEIKTQSVKAKLIEPGFGWIRVSQFKKERLKIFPRS
jgi:carboxyl-terminal processing protease